MRLRLLVLLAGIGIVAVLGGIILLRAATSTVAEHVGEQQISVECTGWTGVSTGCRDWATEILAQGAPSNTFEMDDVSSMRLDRPMLGFAATCVAEYFVSRYPDEVAWTEDVPCQGG